MPKRTTPTLLPKKTPRQSRSRRTFDDIVEAGARLLVRSGYEALTTNHVAEAAGVGVASVYEYFPNKQSIVAAIVTRTSEEVLDELRESLTEALGAAPKDGLRVWLRAMFTAIERRKALIRVLVREVPFLWEIPSVRLLRARLLELSRSARAPDMKPSILEHHESVAYLMTVMVQAAVLESVLHPPPHLAQDELRETLTQLLLELLT